MWKIILIAVVAFALLAGACYRLNKRRKSGYEVHEILHLSDFETLMESLMAKLPPDRILSAVRMTGEKIPAELKRRMTNTSNTLVLLTHVSAEGTDLRVLDVVECVSLGVELESMFSENNNCIIVKKSCLYQS